MKVLIPLLFVSWVIVSCGVKGPPLPPISATPATPEEKSLGRQAIAVSPLPEPTNSAGPLVPGMRGPTPPPTSE